MKTVNVNKPDVFSHVKYGEKVGRKDLIVRGHNLGFMRALK